MSSDGKCTKLHSSKYDSRINKPEISFNLHINLVTNFHVQLNKTFWDNRLYL